MTTADFRRIALSLDGVEEVSHAGLPAFRVGGRRLDSLASQAQGYGNLALTLNRCRPTIHGVSWRSLARDRAFFWQKENVLDRKLRVVLVHRAHASVDRRVLAVLLWNPASRHRRASRRAPGTDHRPLCPRPC